MQVEKISSKELSREYNITVPAKDISASVDNKLTQLSKKLKVPGFRPGKVPLAIVKKSHGQSVLGEVIDSVIQNSSREALTKEGIRAASTPKIEILKFEEGADLKYKMEVEILPEVPEVKFSKIKIEKPKVEISKENIHEGIKMVASRHKHFHKADRAAKDGDAVIIDFKGFIDDEAFPGGEGKNYTLELGSKSFIDNFEDQLVGSKAGDGIKVKVKFPKDYHAKDLAGKPAVFEVKVHEVQEVERHEKIDEEFAKHMGFDTLERLEDVMKQQIQREVDASVRVKLKKQLFDQLDEMMDFQIPQQMTEQEFKSVWDQVQNAIKQNPDSEDAGKSEAELKKEYHKMAERRVRLGILLSDVSNKNKIAVTQDELRAAIAAEARNFPGQEQKVFEFYAKNPTYIDNLRGPLLEEKAVNFILEQVAVKEIEMTLDELREEENSDNEDSSGKKTKKSDAKKSTSKKGKKSSE